jgi:hypothetical protein
MRSPIARPVSRRRRRKSRQLKRFRRDGWSALLRAECPKTELAIGLVAAPGVQAPLAASGVG